MAPFPPEATCVLPMSAHEYYAIQYQPSFRALFASVMDLELEILDVWKEKDGARCEKVRNRPNYEKWVPKIGRKFVKPDDIAFIDETNYGTQTQPPYKMHINSLLPMLGDRVQIRRVVVITAEDENHCRHTITGEVMVRVPGVGKMVEKYVMKNTISALEMLDTVVARYKKVRESVTAEEAPADLPDDLKHLLQEPYQNGRIPVSEDVSARTAFAAEEEEESDGADSALSHPKPLQRATTQFYDAEEHPWDEDMDLERYLQSSEEEDGTEEETEKAVDGVTVHHEKADAAPVRHKHIGDHNLRARMRARRHAQRERQQQQNERSRQFFEHLGQSMRRRRTDAITSGQAELLSSRGKKDEVLKWNEDLQRWERVWKSSHAASIPRAFEKVFSPLTKAVDRIRASRCSPSDSEESVSEESPPRSRSSTSASSKKANVKSLKKMSLSQHQRQ